MRTHSQARETGRGFHQQLELLRSFTRHQVEVRYKGSFLGAVWTVLTPLIMLGLYVFVFGFVFGSHLGSDSASSRWEYALNLMAGLGVINFVSEIISTAPQLIVNNPNLVKKVVFPLPVIPLASVGAALVQYIISTLLLLVGLLCFGSGLSWHALLWPLVLLPLLMLTVGSAFLLAALGVMLRDLGQLMAFLSTVLLYASAVFYPVAKVRPTAFWEVLKFNPLLHIVELAREVLIWRQIPDLRSLAFVYSCGFLALATGWIVFRKSEPQFADIL